MENKLCAAIGDFDGVHLGHRQVILAAVKNKYGHSPVVYTFVHNCKNARLITDNQTKKELLTSLGAKQIIFDDFSKIKKYPPEDFVKKILIDKYGISSIVCGKDFKFGKNAEGDTELLRKLARKYKIGFTSVKLFDFSGEKLSSSKIRELISDGNMENAENALGHRFSVTGNVVHGKHLATENNTPTVNINFKKGMIVPAYGVYVTKVKVDGEYYSAISNVGIRPSVEKTKEPNIETHLFDFSDEIYDKEITVEFIKMIRPEIKFKNKELLFEQINKDIQMAKNYFHGDRND